MNFDRRGKPRRLAFLPARKVGDMLTKISEKIALVAAVVLPAAMAMAQEAVTPAGEPDQPGLLSPDIMSIIWVLVIFIVMATILYRTAWKNVLKGLKGREDRIRNDIAQAEAARIKAEATLKEFNQQLATAEARVRDILSKGAADAEQLATSIRTRAQQEAEEIKERATKEIEVARDQALTEIYQQTAELATRVAEKILRRNLNADDQRELVNQSLAELQTVGAR
jgi:F-type H+-transporting ATPase subunit b